MLLPALCLLNLPQLPVDVLVIGRLTLRNHDSTLLRVVVILTGKMVLLRLDLCGG
jgi:hypothetical protein